MILWKLEVRLRNIFCAKCFSTQVKRHKTRLNHGFRVSDIFQFYRSSLFFCVQAFLKLSNSHFFLASVCLFFKEILESVRRGWIVNASMAEQFKLSSESVEAVSLLKEALQNYNSTIYRPTSSTTPCGLPFRLNTIATTVKASNYQQQPRSVLPPSFMPPNTGSTSSMRQTPIQGPLRREEWVLEITVRLNRLV